MRWIVAIALSLALLSMSSASVQAASAEEAYTATIVWTENTGCTNTQVILKVLKIVKPNLHERSTLQVDRFDHCVGDTIHLRLVIEDFSITEQSISAHMLEMTPTFTGRMHLGRSMVITSQLIRFVSTIFPNADVVSTAEISARVQILLPRGDELLVIDLTTIGEISYMYHTGITMPE